MGTWRLADIDRVVSVVQALNEVEWPQTRTVVRELLEGLGWTSTPRGLGMFSDLGVTPGAVYLPAIDDELTDVEFVVCDMFPDDDRDNKADFLQDSFADYTASFRKLWGAPIITRSTPDEEVWWSVQNGCILKVKRAGEALRIEFATPLGVKIDQMPDVML